MKVLVVQTAFLGDAILMTSMVESIANHNQEIEIQVLVRSGHGVLFECNPYITKVWEFQKEKNKLKNIIKLAAELRSEAFDVAFNCHRFASSGLISVLSRARSVIGFKKNPLSLFYSKKAEHEYKTDWHEVDRNHALLKALWPDIKIRQPKLYPSVEQLQKANKIAQGETFIVIAPSSVWFTKQYPITGWRNLLSKIKDVEVFLIGTETDVSTCEKIASGFKNVEIVAGALSLMESVALISRAARVYACDSAPTHMASAVNVETHTVFCSTSPEFGFGPLAAGSKVHQTNEKLSCRPCGLHGKKVCPKGHFKCSNLDIQV